MGYITAIGQDRPGDAFMALWAAEGVDTGTVLRNPEAPTALYVVTHDDGGHAFTFYRSNSAASRYAPRDVPAAAIRGARILHVSGISQAISTSACDAVFEAIAVAKAAGVKLSYDTNLRLSLWPQARAAAVIHAAIAQADIALPSLDDARVLTGLEAPEAIAEFYLRLGCPIVLLKQGKDGVLVATAEGGRTLIQPCRVQAVDATGAVTPSLAPSWPAAWPATTRSPRPPTRMPVQRCPPRDMARWRLFPDQRRCGRCCSKRRGKARVYSAGHVAVSVGDAPAPLAAATPAAARLHRGTAAADGADPRSR